MRWLWLAFLFLLAYIEITLFIHVTSIVGLALALVLLISTSCLGVSLVRHQGLKTFRQLQQKLTLSENPTTEVTNSVFLWLSGFLLLLPGFFTDLVGLLLLLPLVQKRLPHIGTLYSTPPNKRSSTHHTIEGEYQHKEDN